MVSNAIHQDDLYVEMTFAEVMDRVGLDATTEQYGEMFRDSKYSLWHANAGARRNLNRGIKAPMSGHPKYNVHANDIDFQIESDFIGLMTPGLPRESNKYADRVGRVMNYGDGLYGGMFFGAMYSAAFFENDPRKVVERALLSIPAESGYAQVIRDVLAWHAQYPNDWRKTWAAARGEVEQGRLVPGRRPGPVQHRRPAERRLRGAGPALRRRRLGEDDGDLHPRRAGLRLQPLERRRRPGRDPRLREDPGPSTRAGSPKLADEKFEYTKYSFNEIVASTVERALKVIVSAGGQTTADAVGIPAQAPQAPALEQWDSGVPVARLEFDAPAWSWKGGWQVVTQKNDWSQWKAKQAATAGDEAILTFEGTGVAVSGTMTQAGGRADVWLDGQPQDLRVDAWIPERTFDNDYWHVTGLRPGRHTLRIVVRDDADPRSSGKNVSIERAIVYRDAK